MISHNLLEGNLIKTKKYMLASYPCFKARFEAFNADSSRDANSGFSLNGTNTLPVVAARRAATTGPQSKLAVVR